MMDRMEKLQRKWAKCKMCKLWERRRNVVFGRGFTEGVQILFIGEAPGKSEDMLGEPFMGPSGVLLRQAMKDALTVAELDCVPVHYITNTVCCRPCDELHGSNRAPEKDELIACKPRLIDLHKLLKPKKVVFIGKVAETSLRTIFRNGAMVRHPAFVLRRGGRSSAEYIILVSALASLFKESTL